jgi:AcrR family transcriptional regulator
MDAALHLIATRGIAGLTTRALAEQVGLTTGAIFRHFPTIDALLEGVAARVEVVLDATYPPGELPPLERLTRFVEARSETVGKNAGIVRLVLSEQFLLALPPAASERLSQCVARTRRFILACILEAQRDGTIRDDVDATALATIVMGTTQVLALAGSRRHGGGSTTQRRATRDALVVLLRRSDERRASGRASVSLSVGARARRRSPGR